MCEIIVEIVCICDWFVCVTLVSFHKDENGTDACER